MPKSNPPAQQTSLLSEIKFNVMYNQACVQLRNSHTAENSREPLKMPFRCGSKGFWCMPGQRWIVAVKPRVGKLGKFVPGMLNTKAKALLEVEKKKPAWKQRVTQEHRGRLRMGRMWLHCQQMLDGVLSHKGHLNGSLSSFSSGLKNWDICWLSF